MGGDVNFDAPGLLGTCAAMMGSALLHWGYTRQGLPVLLPFDRLPSGQDP